MRERLQHEGEGILLIYNNALDAEALKPYLPPGGVARVLVTSNAHAWRGVAEPRDRGGTILWPAPAAPRSAPPPRRCRKRSTSFPSPTSRPPPIASGLEVPLAEYLLRRATRRLIITTGSRWGTPKLTLGAVCLSRTIRWTRKT
jgi:hypothetical protein